MLRLAVQCIVIGPVCVCVFAMGRAGVFVCLWVCYHENSKLRASILITGFVGKGSDHLQLLNFGRPAPPGRGSVVG